MKTERTANSINFKDELIQNKSLQKKNKQQQQASRCDFRDYSDLNFSADRLT